MRKTFLIGMLVSAALVLAVGGWIVGGGRIVKKEARGPLALASAALRLARTSASSSSAARPGNGRGGTLNSML